MYMAKLQVHARRGLSNLPFVKMAGFCVKIVCFAIRDQNFDHFRYKMVSDANKALAANPK
jgi:hypothetical protein